MGKYKDPGQGARIFGSVLLILLCSVLVGSIIKTIFGGSSYTFSSFLSYIQDVPQIDISYVEIFNIGGDWGIIDGLRRFLNHIMSIANFGVWFTKQLLNCVSFLFYFLRFMIVGG